MVFRSSGARVLIQELSPTPYAVGYGLSAVRACADQASSPLA